MSETTPSDAAASPPSDLVCRRCGYELRGHDLDDRCPECGTPVLLSTRGDAILDQDPAWVRRLAGGAWLIEMSVILTLGLIVATAFTRPMWEDPATSDVYVMALLAAYAIFIGGGLIGGVLLTAPEMNRARVEPLWSARRVTRVSFAVAVPVGVSWWLTRNLLVGEALAILFTACAGVTTIVACRHVATLARRLPRTGLYRKLRGTPYIAVLASLGSIVVLIWFLPSVSTTRLTLSTVFFVLVILCAFGTLTIILTIAFSMTSMRRELHAIVREQRRYARERS